MGARSILEWVFQASTDEQGQDSTAEEHNRYRRPPKGIPIRDWFVQMARARYGDFTPGAVFRALDKGEEDGKETESG